MEVSGNFQKNNKDEWRSNNRPIIAFYIGHKVCYLNLRTAIKKKKNQPKIDIWKSPFFYKVPKLGEVLIQAIDKNTGLKYDSYVDTTSIQIMDKKLFKEIYMKNQFDLNRKVSWVVINKIMSQIALNKNQYTLQEVYKDPNENKLKSKIIHSIRDITDEGTIIENFNDITVDNTFKRIYDKLHYLSNIFFYPDKDVMSEFSKNLNIDYVIRKYKLPYRMYFGLSMKKAGFTFANDSTKISSEEINRHFDKPEDFISIPLLRKNKDDNNNNELTFSEALFEIGELFNREKSKS
ncbi:Mbov_0400 family ICE element protein [Mycoplasma sp. 2248]|uniref:Mbov_0400 family ICE element protein n=1 Tax=Mycoplasma sp. 2248 TaxID=3108528 RepID=UPI003A4C582A